MPVPRIDALPGLFPPGGFERFALAIFDLNQPAQLALHVRRLQFLPANETLALRLVALFQLIFLRQIRCVAFAIAVVLNLLRD